MELAYGVVYIGGFDSTGLVVAAGFDSDGVGVGIGLGGGWLGGLQSKLTL